MNKQEKFKRSLFRQLDYVPHKGQLKLHYPRKKTAKFTVLCCGRRWGKSMAAAMEAIYTITQPNKRVWVVAPTYQLAEKVFRVVYQKLVLELGWKPRRSSEKELYLEFDWGSSIQGKSGVKLESLLGESNSLVIMDEAASIPERVWTQYLRPTLADQKDSKAIFISTPTGYNHFHDKFQLAESDKWWEAHRSPSWENHHAFPKGEKDDDLLEIKRNSSPQVWRQEICAEFTAMTGLVFDMFREETHVGDFPYNPALQTFGSIDFGYRQPNFIVAQTWKDQNNIEHINIVDEIAHIRNVTTERLAKMILQKGYNITRFYSDIAGGQVQSQTGGSDIELMRQYGIYCRPPRDRASRVISTGIDHMRSFFENAEGFNRIHIHKKCTGLISDLKSYRYELDKDNKPLKENPLKDGVSDHGIDSLRYLLVCHYPIKNQKLRVIKR